jgi:hypothetical protein
MQVASQPIDDASTPLLFPLPLDDLLADVPIASAP